MEELVQKLTALKDEFLLWLTSPTAYIQAGIVVVAVFLALIVARLIRTQLKSAPESLEQPATGFFRDLLSKAQALLFPILAIFSFILAIEVSKLITGQAGLVRIALGVSVVMLIRAFITRFVSTKMIIILTNWVGVPVALMHVFGVLDDVTAYLDTFAINVGNIEFSAYSLARTLFFGVILFWLGRISNATGKQVIRNTASLDVRSRELFSKLFEIGLFIVVFLLLMQVMGINLTTLAVFGGAVGVGLGFGLQQIASNFISGLIILLDKSLTIGDFIELEDGSSGTLRELTMRSATLETYDGKDIIVPNEKFITTTFVNWTHYNTKQRYPIIIQVAYSTDLPALFDLLREVVSNHPKVLSGPDVPIEERPDAEIESFADSGINILIEFWMEGVDDGENRVGGDLLLMIWMALKEHGIEIPFPQREVTIVGEKKLVKG